MIVNKKIMLAIVMLMIVLTLIIKQREQVATVLPFTQESTWKYHKSLEGVNWSEEKIEVAKDYFNSLNSTALFVVYDGKVLLSWGNVTKNTNAHSVRKSFLSSLYGIHHIHLNDTLHQLAISDIPELTIQEKQASIRDLMTSSSGVYIPSAEETRNMIQNRPQRESHPPGGFFYYNNWDFNVLGTIFNKQTNKDLFQEFYEKIASPLEMEDFSLTDTSYRNVENKSIHPAYLFRMSARDMARFGQLFLQNGSWNGKQIIPQQWIKESTSVQIRVPENQTYDYGYMWWVATDGPFRELGMYSAVGRFGQSIDVIPSEKLVIVHRVDSDKGRFRLPIRGVSQTERLTLIQFILDAKLEHK
ncbi:serine hydrolase domain-containing protein [Bacillus alkalicellulosilyticus]|uniref:serine hydrolase domain-containing protein n=1 Tax=Alkalihalobacterium alkalicellulosilyticum TaxID=1912214 RepID=UPI001FE3348D|nr:serine hydrolase [Bacillus alkalicellulosilyticus]